jgi:hypothetical protein
MVENGSYFSYCWNETIFGGSQWRNNMVIILDIGLVDQVLTSSSCADKKIKE